MKKLNQENTNFNKIDMNAQEARKIAEEIKITPEIEDTIGEIKKRQCWVISQFIKTHYQNRQETTSINWVIVLNGLTYKETVIGK